MKKASSAWARLSVWLWLPPAAAVCAFILSLILYSEAFWPVVEALSWYYCYFSQYAAIWFGIAAALVSVVAAAAEKRSGRKWSRYIVCGAGHALCGLFLQAWLEVLMSV